MAKAETTTWNLNDVASKRRLMEHIGQLKGLHDVTFKARIKTRSLDANAYYWAAVVTPFMHVLRDSYGDNSITLEDAHEVLKRQILGTRKLGETGFEVSRATRTLDKAEFSDYIEKCAAWLAEFFEIVVIPSDLFWEMQGR